MSFVTHTPPAGLIGYALNRKGSAYCEPQGAMFDYILAGNGLYLAAERDEMVVAFPIAQADVRDLEPAGPLFDFDLPPVPLSIVYDLLVISGDYAKQGLETLFWLQYSPLNPYNNGWLLHQPEQRRTSMSCKPAGGQDDLYDHILIEVHSHPRHSPARFSSIDDRDEVGFRLYGVIGGLPERPEIRMRVGVYGAGFWEISASWVMELPEGLADCNPDENNEDKAAWGNRFDG